ncbi:MAG TPA: hypothetical protein VG502_20695 [Flexivirga sp.]|uniref:hypothetical protein n=1 Tax=Flexivirga sp. TaxID=1962927 RepID=UPI002B9AAED3|nr:hypothetical protein [Flexivirga sp.]HWC24723.1 hypothetical protein [Flexivirga sp.]
MGLLSRLFDPEGSSGRLRAQAESRLQSASQAVTDSSGDSVQALLRKNQALILEINSSAGELPTIGVVLARAVTDTVREVLTSGEADRLDIGVRVAINGTLTDYLPGSIRAYVGAVRAAAPAHRGSSSAEERSGGARIETATDALVEQLTTLRRSVEQLAEASRSRDMQALQVHGRFLEDKFGESDLDL